MRRYVEAYFRHPILLMLPVLVAVAASSAYVVRQPNAFRGGASLWCDTPVPNPSSIFGGSSQQSPAETQRAVLTELLLARTFLEKVGEKAVPSRYGTNGPKARADDALFQLARDVQVSTGGPHLLLVSTTGGTPRRASQLADAVMRTYIDEVNDTQRARAQSSLVFYRSQMDEASKALSDARAKLTQYAQANQGGGPAGTATDATIAQLTEQVSGAQANYDKAKGDASSAQLVISSGSDSGVVRVFDPATASPVPVGRRKKLVFAGAAGIFGGLMVSFLAILLLVGTDRAVRGAVDVEAIRMPVVATVKEIGPKRRRRKKAS